MYAAPPSEDVQKCMWNECGVQFDDAEALYEHITTSHIGRKSAGTLSLECQWQGCNSKATKRDHLTSHMRVHINLKPHKCTVCAKSFKRPQDLKKHEKIHTEEHHVNHRHSKALTIAPDGLSGDCSSLTPATTPLAHSVPPSATPAPTTLPPAGHNGVPQLANFSYGAPFPGYGFHPAMMYGGGGMPGMHPHQPQLDLAQLVAYQQQLTAQQQAGFQINPNQMGQAYGMGLYPGGQAFPQGIQGGAVSGGPSGAGVYQQAGIGFAQFGYGMYPGLQQQQPHAQQHHGVQSMYPSLGAVTAPMTQPNNLGSLSNGASLYPSLDGFASHPHPHPHPNQLIKLEDHPSPSHSARSAHSSSLHSPAPSGAASSSSVSPRTNSTTLSPPGLSYSPSPERETESSLGLGLSRGKKRERGFEDAAGQFLGDLRRKKYSGIDDAGPELDALSSLLLDSHANTPTLSQASGPPSLQSITKEDAESMNQLLLSLGTQIPLDQSAYSHAPQFDHAPAPFAMDAFNPAVPTGGHGMYPTLPRINYGQPHPQAQHAMYPPSNMATGGIHPGNFDYATVRLSKPAPAPTLVNDVRLPTYQNVNRLGRAAPSAHLYRDTPMDVDDDESEHGKAYTSSLRSTSEEGPKLPPLVGVSPGGPPERTTLPPIRDLLRHSSSSSVGSTSMAESTSSHSSTSSGRSVYPSLSGDRRPVSAGGVDRLTSSVRLFGMRSPTADLDEHVEDEDDVLEPKSEDSDELTAGEEEVSLERAHKHKRSRTELAVAGPSEVEAEAKAKAEVRERRLFALKALVVYVNATLRQQMLADKWDEVRREGRVVAREDGDVVAVEA